MKYLFFLLPYLVISQNTYKIEYFESYDNKNSFRKGELLANDKENFYISKDTDSIPPKTEKLVSTDFVVTEKDGNDEIYSTSIILPSTFESMTFFRKSWKYFVFNNKNGNDDKEDLIESNLPNIDWKITKETKRILGLECKKAIGVYKCRQYTVWFTKDIPLKVGPWHLNGLPGAILEAKESNGYNEFVAVKITKNVKDNLEVKIDSYLKNQEKIKYDDFLKKLDEESIEWSKSLISSFSEKIIEGATIISLKSTYSFVTFDLCRESKGKQVSKNFTE